MTPMTEKKSEALEKRGAKKLGYIFQDIDGQIAYVEGGMVRWLSGNEHDINMLRCQPEMEGGGFLETDLLPEDKVLHDSRTAECSSCHKVELLVVDSNECFNCSVLMELPPPPPPAGPPLRHVNEDKPVSRSGVIFNWTGVVLMGLVFYAGLFWGIPFAAFSNTTEESMGCSLTELIIFLHAIVGLIVWCSIAVGNLTEKKGRNFLRLKNPERQ